MDRSERQDGLEVVTTAEMAEADRLTARSGTPGAVLMDRAGQAVATAATRILGRSGGRRVLVLCGPGNNGGDGYVAAAALARAGFAVEVAALAPTATLKGDAAGAAGAWHGPVRDAASVASEGRDLIVDALFGAGLSRPLEGPARSLVERVNMARCDVLSIDLPSGLSGDTGQVQGAAIRATETVAFFRLKPGHLLMPGRALCGLVTLADIGIPDSVLDAAGPTLRRNVPALWWPVFPRPSAEGHKYARGHLVVVSGPLPALGAARLSARGGLRAGAGLVTVASPPEALPIHAAQLTAIMLKSYAAADGLRDILADPRLNAIVIGPGLGHHAGSRALVETALAPGAKPRAAVVDADALTLYAGRPDALAVLARAAFGPVVVTPHDGEFHKLFQGLDDVLHAPSKVERARAAARHLGAVVVLKGPDTVVAAPDGSAAIAGDDAPWLATAGSGDVLAGLIGGLLAQAMPAFEAASAAVWLHAAAARHFGPGLIAEDLPEALPAVLRVLLERTGSGDPSGREPRQST